MSWGGKDIGIRKSEFVAKKSIPLFTTLMLNICKCLSVKPFLSYGKSQGVGWTCSKCRTLKSLSQTVSAQVPPVRYQSKPGHNQPGSKCHTGTQA